MAAGLAGAMCARASIVVGAGDVQLTQSYNGTSWDVMPTTYGGLTWQSSGSAGTEYADNWEAISLNSDFQSYYNTSLTAQSGSQAAYNGGNNGWSETLSVSGTPFLFDGVYFASWPNANPAGASEVTVRGLLDGQQEWSITENINSSGWTYFDGTGTTAVDELLIGDGSNSPWLMDTLSISSPVVPEPTTIISGMLMLLPFGASALRILRKGQMV